MNKEIRIAIACFIGGVLGALLALQFSRYLWWLGILIGGGAGYLSYEFGMVIKAAKTAWEELCTEYETGFARLRRLLTEGVLVVKMVIAIYAITILSLLHGLSWILLFASIFFPSFFFENRSDHIFGSLMAMSTIAGPVSVVIYALHLQRSRKIDITVALWVAPLEVNAMVVLFRWLPKIIIRLARESPIAVRLLTKFVKRTFILIHSEIRLLCMTDAMIGAVTGYYFGNALVGGIVGALCGVLNYKLISVKLLKLAGN